MKTIEEKAKAYDEAINRMKHYVVDKYGCSRIKVADVFPELKESEDERVKNEIIAFVEQSIHRGGGTPIPQEQENRWLAWLEKQGEQKPANKCIGCNNFKGCITCTDGDQYAHIREQKPTDKVKPKFKVGDWVVQGKKLYQIEKVTSLPDNHFQYWTTDGVWFGDGTKAHLWTIQDAKDGDVLLSPSTPKGDKECAFIFKEIDENGIVRFHIALLQSESIKIADGITNVMGYANAGYHTPATKEQRDLLFQKMKEAGYEWDATKKELKKIEHTPAWSEEDETGWTNTIIMIKEVASNHYTKDSIKLVIDWLKSLKQRMKGE